MDDKKAYSMHLTVSQIIIAGAVALAIIYGLHWSSEHMTSTTDPLIGTHIAN